MSAESSNGRGMCSFENTVPSDESLCLDDIMRLKERRLKLLHEYKSEEEDDSSGEETPIRKKAKLVPKPKKKPDATVKVPSRRSERIKSQTVSENKPPEPSGSELVKRERPIGKVRPMIRVKPVVRERSVPRERLVPRERPMIREIFASGDPPSWATEGPQSRETSLARARPQSGGTSLARTRPQIGETSLTRARPQIEETVLVRARPQSGGTSLARARPQSGGTSLARARPQIGETSLTRARPQIGETVLARARPQIGETALARERPRSSGETATVRVNAADPAITQKAGNIYGPIPDIEVGHQWETRMECSQDGVHRPTVAGIHPGPMGAYSIALSGGYPEDIDEGHTVIFTGAGGRDLKGTTGRTKSVSHAPQVKDQELNNSNWSLVRSSETGVPVRVIRGHKLLGEYAPRYGYRYDGLYRVVQYCYTYGYSGYRIYRFRLCRMEGQGPAPWEIRSGINPVMDRILYRRKPVSVTGGELDREINVCIRKMSQEPHFYDDDNNDGWPPETFSGWSMS